VALRGGYEGVGTPGTNNARRWPTVITRAMGAPRFRILSLSGVSDARIESLTLARGETSNSEPGGGVRALDSAVTLRDCQIVSNLAYEAEGGGLYLSNCTATLVACTVAENRSSTSWGGKGGGLSIAGGSMDASDSVFRANWATGANPGLLHSYGGGINVNAGTVGLRNCQVLSNVCYTASALTNQYGAGIYLGGGTTMMDHCTVMANRGESYQRDGTILHEGIRYGGGKVTLTNCLVQGHEVDLANFPVGTQSVQTNGPRGSIGN
jgi:hypothetical protein